MWRNVAKQATLKSQSNSLNFPPFPRTHSFLGASKEPIFFGKFKFHSLNNTSPRGNVSVAEAVSSTDVEDNVSSTDEVQELLPEMRKQEEKEERFRGRRKLNANPGIGSRKHRVLRRRQVKIEAEAWELATKEYKELLKDMCEHKLAPNLPYMKSLFLGWFEPFADAIAKEQELIRTGKSRQAYAPYFDLLPADKMSVIAMHQLAAIVMTGGEHGCARVVTAACMIGDAIEQEIRIHNILEKTRKKKEKADDRKNGVEGESPSVMKEQENLRKKVTDLIKKQKLPAVRKIVKGKDDSKPWNADARAKVGSRLIELLLQTAYIQPPCDQLADSSSEPRPAFVHTSRTVSYENKKGAKKYGVIQCDPLVLKGLEKTVFISNFKCARSKEATDDYVGEMAQTDLLSQTDLNPFILASEEVGEAIFIGVCGMGGIGNMNKLMVLRLDETVITELSSSTHHLIGLRLLSMNSCKNLTRIPEGISCLKLLKKLDLSGCSRLEYIPKNLGEVAGLEEFDLSGTSIKQLPTSISLLKNLKVLSLDGCKRIAVLPSFSGLCSLEVLGLHACRLREGALPEDIGCLSSLVSLDLSRNNFVSLPRGIYQLFRLELLVLEDCKMLKSLPWVPSKVQTVNLNGCIRLKEIPDPINLSSSKRSEFLCLNCWELYKHNDLDSMGGLSNPRPGFGIVVPGNEIPGWFNHQKKGSSISVEVHSWSMGFVACVAFSASGESPSLFCHFKANGRENYPSLMGISCNSIQVLSDHLWLFYLSFDYLKELKEWQHESFGSFELSFHSSERVKVKNCGVFLLYSLHSPPSSQSYEDPSRTYYLRDCGFTGDSVNYYEMHFPVIRGVDTSNAFTHLSSSPTLRGTILGDKELEKHRGSTTYLGPRSECHAEGSTDRAKTESVDPAIAESAEAAVPASREVPAAPESRSAAPAAAPATTHP
ncbi:hypothetical protein DKX38_027178 [Salix brachista]|uniref:DNA-directed RNA polymerase N-terminal domain-containing protein n=1 Tax=Salix brachista TaxID=2182728 RepID=A0A5N5JFG3_9ROSI|nr:hypothetical protein DKX38_027178 [Salix brachista]